MTPPVADTQLVITVTRSGGFAGLVRVWEVEVAEREPEAERWRAMVAPVAASAERDGDGESRPDAAEPTKRARTRTASPDADHEREQATDDQAERDRSDTVPLIDDAHPPLTSPPASRGADRFVWTIVIVDDPHRWTMRCPENDLTDDARALIDAVRRDGSRPR